MDAKTKLDLNWANFTFDDRAIFVSGVLQPGQSEDGMNAHNGELVPQTDEHVVVDAFVEIVVDLRVLTHCAQQFVDELAAAETHRFVACVMML